MEQAEGLLGAARDLAEEPAAARRRRDQRTELRDGLIVLLLAAVGPRVSELTAANAEDFFVNGGRGTGGSSARAGGRGTCRSPVRWRRCWTRIWRTAGRCWTGGGAEGAAAVVAGRRLARGDVQGVIDRVLERVEPVRRRSVTPHGLRHTTATHLLAAATDMDAVRRVLGHADLSTLGRYRDELPGELEAAMRVHPLLGPVEGRRG